MVQISLVISDGAGISSTMLTPSHIAVLTTPLSRHGNTALEIRLLFSRSLFTETIIAEFPGKFKGISEIPKKISDRHDGTLYPYRIRKSDDFIPIPCPGGLTKFMESGIILGV